MATKISMRHAQTGIMKVGFYGFSWTTFLFGPFPALFRGDFLGFLTFVAIAFVVALITAGFGMILVWLAPPFFYNGIYTRRLQERGYELAGSDGDNALAAASLGVQLQGGRGASQGTYRNPL